jgi:hypothetical protein
MRATASASPRRAANGRTRTAGEFDGEGVGGGGVGVGGGLAGAVVDVMTVRPVATGASAWHTVIVPRVRIGRADDDEGRMRK